MHRFCCATMLALGAITGAGSAQAQMSESPISSGFWTWPREKLSKAEDIAATCKTKIAVQFPDGRYFGMTFQTSGEGAEAKRLPPIVDEVGRCRFDKDAQIERCELAVMDETGNTTRGTLESRFSKEADGALKMSVVAKTEGGTGGAGDSTSFDVYPVRCPDEVVWETLNGRPLPQ